MATTKLIGTLIESGSVPPVVLSGGIVSSSAQVDYNSVANKLSGVVSGAAQVVSLLPAGAVSGSAQVTTLLPVGIFSSSAQLPAGTVSGSAQVDYNSITNKLSGVVSASAQVAPLLPAGTVSSSVAAVAGPAENLYLATNFGGFTPWL